MNLIDLYAMREKVLHARDQTKGGIGFIRDLLDTANQNFCLEEVVGEFELGNMLQVRQAWR